MCAEGAQAGVEVFLLAENRLLREALAKILRKKNDIRVVGAASFSPSALKQITDAAIVRIDPTVNFTWLQASPGPGVAVDNFSVRWTGQVQAPVAGNYTFSTVSDDGVRLWVNGLLVIDNWTNHGTTTNNSAPIALVAGTKYDIRMEFYEGTWDAVARLLWAYPGQAQTVIPQSRLFP